MHIRNRQKALRLNRYISCGVGEGSGLNEVSSVLSNTTAPAAINKLSTSKVSVDSVKLTWATPRDNENTGTAVTVSV